MRQKIVFLTGAGISAESGLATFRGKDGLWTNEKWVELATVDSLENNTQECLDFYNWRRRQLSEVEPNEAHRLIAALEKDHDVTVITQNVDDLHERAGSTNVIHLHGELRKVCASVDRYNPAYVKDYPLTTPILRGDKAGDGSQLRPFIVMFGESVEAIIHCPDIIRTADIFVVIGTSLNVYPAAGLISYAHREIPKFVINPGEMSECVRLGFQHLAMKASDGMVRLMEEIRLLTE